VVSCRSDSFSRFTSPEGLRWMKVQWCPPLPREAKKAVGRAKNWPSRPSRTEIRARASSKRWAGIPKAWKARPSSRQSAISGGVPAGGTVAEPGASGVDMPQVSGPRATLRILITSAGESADRPMVLPILEVP